MARADSGVSAAGLATTVQPAASAGRLGANSATMRQAAVQRYLHEHLRSRINAFERMLYTAAATVLSLAIGWMGEWMDYRLCVTVCGAFAMLVCWGTI